MIREMEWDHAIVNESDADDVRCAHNNSVEVREQNHRNTSKRCQQRPVALFQIALMGTNGSRSNAHTNRDRIVL